MIRFSGSPRPLLKQKLSEMYSLNQIILLGWANSYMCWGLHFHFVRVLGDSHQPQY